MFERYTESARQVVTLAIEEAKEFGHHLVNDEHILFGLCQEEALASKILASFSLDADTVEQDIVDIVGRVKPKPPSETLTPSFSDRASEVFELALREALSLGHNYIGTEHILLALIRPAEESVTRKILSKHDVGTNQLRVALIHALSGEPRLKPPEPWYKRHQEFSPLSMGDIVFLPDERETIERAAFACDQFPNTWVKLALLETARIVNEEREANLRNLREFAQGSRDIPPPPD